MSDFIIKKKLRDIAEDISGTRPTERSLRGIIEYIEKEANIVYENPSNTLKGRLRDLGYALNGVRPTERSLREIANNIVENYSGGGASYVNYISTGNFEIYGSYAVTDKKNLYLGTEMTKVAKFNIKTKKAQTLFDTYTDYNASHPIAYYDDYVFRRGSGNTIQIDDLKSLTTATVVLGSYSATDKAYHTAVYCNGYIYFFQVKNQHAYSDFKCNVENLRNTGIPSPLSATNLSTNLRNYLNDYGNYKSTVIGNKIYFMAWLYGQSPVFFEIDTETEQVRQLEVDNFPSISSYSDNVGFAGVGDALYVFGFTETTQAIFETAIYRVYIEKPAGTSGWGVLDTAIIALPDEITGMGAGQVVIGKKIYCTSFDKNEVKATNEILEITIPV